MPSELENIERATLRALSSPAPDFKFPPPPTQAQIERLAALERELVDRVLAKAILAPLEMQIVVLRATMYG